MNYKFLQPSFRYFKLNNQNFVDINFLKMLKKTKNYSIIIVVAILFLCFNSPKILAQIESLYNSNSDQFAGITNLMSAVANNDIQGASFFSKGGSLIVNQKNKGGATALHIACREGNPEIVRILLQNGANPNIQDNEGWSSLMRASIVGSPQIVDMLLTSGAKANLLNQQNESAIVHATMSRCTECINLIIEKSNLAKELDTLTLKSQIADAFLIARNQEHKNNQGILESYLDYISKLTPLIAKSNNNSFKYDAPPALSKEKNFIFKSQDMDDDYPKMTEKPFFGYEKPVEKTTEINLDPIANSQQNIAPPIKLPNKFVFKKPLDESKPNLPIDKKEIDNNLGQLSNNIDNSPKTFKFKSSTQETLTTPIVEPKNNLSTPLDLTPKKFKFTPIANSQQNSKNQFDKSVSSDLSNIDDKSKTQVPQSDFSKDKDAIVLIDKKNKSAILPENANNSAVNNNSNLPKTFKFKPTSKDTATTLVEPNNNLSTPLDLAPKKFKFTPISKQNAITPESTSENNSKPLTINLSGQAPQTDFSEDKDAIVLIDKKNKSVNSPENTNNSAVNNANNLPKTFKFKPASKDTATTLVEPKDNLSTPLDLAGKKFKFTANEKNNIQAKKFKLNSATVNKNSVNSDNINSQPAQVLSPETKIQEQSSIDNKITQSQQNSPQQNLPEENSSDKKSSENKISKFFNLFKGDNKSKSTNNSSDEFKTSPENNLNSVNNISTNSNTTESSSDKPNDDQTINLNDNFSDKEALDNKSNNPIGETLSF
jgi:ankyrin repeat protein